MSETRDVIVKLLSNIGGRKEVEQYLRQYSAAPQQKFAVIAVAGDLLADQRETVAGALAFLDQVGLLPIVVHDAARDDTRVDSGNARPSAPALDLVRRHQQENLALVEALAAQGSAARPVASGAFTAEHDDDGPHGLSGRVVAVDTAAIESAVRSRQLPIVSCLGTSRGGQLLELDEDEAAMALCRRLQPHKLIFLSRQGGLLDEHGRVLPAVNLAEDYEPLRAEPWLRVADRERLEDVAALLDELPESSSVSITSPDHLARELFTHHGAGTLVRRGTRVTRVDRFEDLDQTRLRELLETCFGRTLAPGYFDYKRCYRVYVSDDYRATAILTQENGMPYLDKFAVTPQAQGEGLGGSVWGRMRRENPRLFWRARSQNEVNGWYFQQSDGTYKTEKWTVFWYGFHSFAEIQRCVETALGIPPTLRQGESPDG
jgi:acetylglutamate kinase